jgi:nucleotide-binding universal stress UspA family protein
VPDLASQVERENRALLDKVQPTLEKVRCQRHYLNGAADHELLEFAERENIDLIVIGSHGRTGLSRLLLGSVAEAVVRRAKCPVLTVKHPISAASQAAEDQQHEHPDHLEPIAKHSLH